MTDLISPDWMHGECRRIASIMGPNALVVLMVSNNAAWCLHVYPAGITRDPYRIHSGAVTTMLIEAESYARAFVGKAEGAAREYASWFGEDAV